MDAASEVWEGIDGTLYVRAHWASYLTHEEHASIDLGAGLFQVLRQREFTPELRITSWISD